MSGEMIDKIKEAEKKAKEIIKKAEEEKNLMIENAHKKIKELEEKEVESAKNKAKGMLEKAVEEGEEETAYMKGLCGDKRKKIREVSQKNMKKALSFIMEEVKRSMM